MEIFMKSVNVFLGYLTVISIMLLASCSSDSSTNSPTNNTSEYGFTCTLNGGGYTNQAVKIATVTGSVYVLDDDQTAVTCTNDANEVGIVSFKGNKAGTFQITESDENNNLVVITLRQSVYITLVSGTINVTSYGSVGGDVVGTFSGQGMTTVGEQPVQVTNGTFRAKRVI